MQHGKLSICVKSNYLSSKKYYFIKKVKENKLTFVVHAQFAMLHKNLYFLSSNPQSTMAGHDRNHMSCLWIVVDLDRPVTKFCLVSLTKLVFLFCLVWSPTMAVSHELYKTDPT